MSEQTEHSNPGMPLTEKIILGTAITGIVIMLGFISYMVLGPGRIDGTAADDALVNIRASFRMLQSAEGDLSSLAEKYTSGVDLRVLDIKELNLNRSDIENPYFDANAFRVTSLTDSSFVIKAIGDFSRSPERDRINEFTRTIDQDGTLRDE